MQNDTGLINEVIMGNVEYTLDYYKEFADEFYESTIIADVEYLRERFLKHLPAHRFFMLRGIESLI